MLQRFIQNEEPTECSILGNFPCSWFSWWGGGGSNIFTVPSGGGVRFCSVSSSAWHVTELLSHFWDIVPNWFLSISRFGFGIGTRFREHLQASCREKSFKKISEVSDVFSVFLLIGDHETNIANRTRTIKNSSSVVGGPDQLAVYTTRWIRDPDTCRVETSRFQIQCPEALGHATRLIRLENNSSIGNPLSVIISHLFCMLRTHLEV